MTNHLFDKHKARLEDALRAISTREYFSPFIESPSAKHHPSGAKARGKERFERHLEHPHRPVQARHGAIDWRPSEEVSPYTLESIPASYPAFQLDELLDDAKRGFNDWNARSPEHRVGICLEILDQWSTMVFENAYATMHTTGQAFMMAFAGSGANSLDRGLEAIAYAHKAMQDVPTDAIYARRFGPNDVTLKKTFRTKGRGVAAVITCGSYPAWNAYPAILASLATGNPVIVKPHPRCVLPMARCVDVAQHILRDAEMDPSLISLLVDTTDEPIGKALATHPDVGIVDFTGGQLFGRWLEENVRVPLFTETAGCNAVIVESTDDLEETVAAIAQGVALFSSQMCTAPQNIFVPKTGVQTPNGTVDVSTFEHALVAAIDTLTHEHGAAICGAVFDHATIKRIETAAASATVLRASKPYVHDEYPDARTATPLLCRSSPEETIHRSEWFGPIAFVIACDSAEHALELAASDAETHGSIASYAYSTDPAFRERVSDRFWKAGASIGFNLHKHRPINFTAAYSDYHVTGLNPAGNACLTDLAFVANRFRIVQTKTEISRQDND